MSETELKEGIKTALKSLEGEDLLKSARALFHLLGYKSKRTAKLDGSPRKFVEKYGGIMGTKSEEAFLDSVKSIDIIFQIMDGEIKESKSSKNQEFDVEKIKSFLFIAVQLNSRDYARGVYAQMAREVNKHLGMPTVVLFMNDDKATISFMGRRPNKVRKDRHVLGKVFLIRDIDCTNPHRAHLDILADLSLSACLNRMEQEKSFESLLAVWLKTLDTEKLNKEFYDKLHKWYLRAVNKATFPSPADKPVTTQVQVIRLITRILFVWFIKEKHLVSEDLFDEGKVGKLLNDFRPDGRNYYCAILQNLFFATLNTEISQRKFSGKENATHRNFNLYRYKDMLADEKLLLDLMKETPFINGGLFDCLDSEKSTTAGGYRLDCFTDNAVHRKELSVPNSLFFNEKHGLFPLLEKYKFTVEENTPIEQEVALDPELLGKVFENLLAAYNPETSESMQRQTGSYYTPREVVDYMVDEALLAYLGEKVAPEDDDIKLWGERLRYLLDYADAFDDAEELFTDGEKRAISSAVADIRVLDPAVGSGAFPMGVLHKLSLVLRRIDPNNEIWEELQKSRARERAGVAFETDNPDEREEELAEISRTFQTYRESDFGRKLYLIQNSIFGVDIQPIACQIAKLRFFISLAIEQNNTKNENDNFGVKPLPNLETRFVSANTLLGLEKPKQMSIGDTEDVQNLERQLSENRERHFNASNRQKKLDCITEDTELRQKLKEKLKATGLPSEQAEKIANWDPYDQNATADWFSGEYMFGVGDGFNVMIGNPPYIKEYTNRESFDGLRSDPYYQGKMDIWYLFACRGIDMLANEGILTFIAQNNWTTNFGASKMRKKVISGSQILQLIDFGNYKIFETADIQTMIMVFQKNTKLASYSFNYRRLLGTDLEAKDVTSILNQEKSDRTEHLTPTIDREKYIKKLLTFSTSDVQEVLEKISSRTNFYLDPKNEVANGIHHHHDLINKNRAEILKWEYEIGTGIFLISDSEKEKMNLTKDELDIIKPSYTSKELKKWCSIGNNTTWVIYTDSKFKNLKTIERYPNLKKHLDKFKKVITSDNAPYGLHRARKEKFFKGEKIFSLRKCVEPTFTYTDFDCYVSAAFYVIKSDRINMKYLTALLNSDLIKFWLKHRGKMQGSNFQIDKEPILSIPVFSPDENIVNTVSSLVDEIIENIFDLEETKNMENQLNNIFYRLYGLSYAEVKIIDPSFSLSKEEFKGVKNS